jgi:hypothetical protein
MDPIISPWLIWLVSVAANIKVLAVCYIILMGILCAFIPVILDDIDIDDVRKFYSSNKRRVRYLLGVLCFCISLVLFVPNETTAIQMIVAKNITTETVNKAISSGKSIKEDLKKDIIDIINEIKK